MKYLLDASTLLPLILDYGEKIIEITTKITLYTLDLTVYEIGNSLWKLILLLKTLRQRDAENIIHVLGELIKTRITTTIRFEELNLHRIIQIAINEKMTFYYASYIVAAEKINATLATEDKKLREKASKYVNTIEYTKIKETINKILTNNNPQPHIT